MTDLPLEWPEETDNPNYADDRNFYKVEKWTRDGQSVWWGQVGSELMDNRTSRGVG